MCLILELYNNNAHRYSRLVEHKPILNKNKVEFRSEEPVVMCGVILAAATTSCGATATRTQRVYQTSRLQVYRMLLTALGLFHSLQFVCRVTA